LKSYDSLKKRKLGDCSVSFVRDSTLSLGGSLRNSLQNLYAKVWTPKLQKIEGKKQNKYVDKFELPRTKSVPFLWTNFLMLIIFLAFFSGLL